MPKAPRFALLPTALVLTTFLSCLSCTREAPAPPNVILITFDTLRADHLGCYGYGRNTSPRLDALAGAATLYTRTMASAPWTVPTHASLFTGKYPFEHGAHAIKTDSTAKNNVNRLDESFETLAEALREEGYATGAFMGNAPYLHPVWQLDQGFDEKYRRREFADAINEKALEWVSRVRGQRFFLFINYIDAHRPYNTTPRPGFLPEPAPHGEELLDRLTQAVMPGENPPPPDLVGKVIDQYDTAIANVDEQFGNLVDRLREWGLYDNTIIVATSDHGEYFGEHLLVEHSKDIYQEAVWVPLIIKYPHQEEAQVVEIPTSSVDVPGLVFAQFPQEIAARRLETFRDLPGTHPVFTQIYFTRLNDLNHPVWGHRFNRVRAALYDWPYKFIHSTDGNHELYNLALDPAESRNLIPEEPETAGRLLRAMQAFVEERKEARETGSPPPLDEEQIEQLRSLGYVGH